MACVWICAANSVCVFVCTIIGHIGLQLYSNATWCWRTRCISFPLNIYTLFIFVVCQLQCICSTLTRIILPIPAILITLGPYIYHYIYQHFWHPWYQGRNIAERKQCHGCPCLESSHRQVISSIIIDCIVQTRNNFICLAMPFLSSELNKISSWFLVSPKINICPRWNPVAFLLSLHFYVATNDTSQHRTIYNQTLYNKILLNRRGRVTHSCSSKQSIVALQLFDSKPLT